MCVCLCMCVSSTNKISAKILAALRQGNSIFRHSFRLFADTCIGSVAPPTRTANV